MNLQKCAVIGTGFVGATAAYTLATSGLFSELILLDVNRAKAEGEAADISHGVSFAQPCAVHAGDYQDLKDCGLVILAAGANQKPGETRIDLLHRNEVILKSILDAVLAVAPDCILLVVSNPVDLLTYLAQKLSGLPACRVIGTGTVLDTARLKYLVGQYLQVDSRNVHAFIIGEHGDSELAVWSSANVSGMDLPDYCRIAGKEFSQSVLDDIYQNVRDAAYHIIEGKGATYYGIGMTGTAHCTRDRARRALGASGVLGYSGTVWCGRNLSGTAVSLGKKRHRDRARSAAQLRGAQAAGIFGC